MTVCKRREGTVCKKIDGSLQDKDMSMVCKSMRSNLESLDDIWINIVCKGTKYMFVRSYKRKGK